ncbi:unnamed protein product [Caenorhabditis angaria]|uniref:RNA helicase n=1 Tax=Caenorhabditis angaria TaxID=860376 RepID=A0A9P1N911_9PELO|nr:unnamed protein product [Caenorhabditis angaria]
MAFGENNDFGRNSQRRNDDRGGSYNNRRNEEGGERQERSFNSSRQNDDDRGYRNQSDDQRRSRNYEEGRDRNYVDRREHREFSGRDNGQDDYQKGNYNREDNSRGTGFRQPTGFPENTRHNNPRDDGRDNQQKSNQRYDESRQSQRNFGDREDGYRRYSDQDNGRNNGGYQGRNSDSGNRDRQQQDNRGGYQGGNGYNQRGGNHEEFGNRNGYQGGNRNDDRFGNQDNRRNDGRNNDRNEYPDNRRNYDRGNGHQDNGRYDNRGNGYQDNRRNDNRSGSGYNNSQSGGFDNRDGGFQRNNDNGGYRRNDQGYQNGRNNEGFGNSGNDRYNNRSNDGFRGFGGQSGGFNNSGGFTDSGNRGSYNNGGGSGGYPGSGGGFRGGEEQRDRAPRDWMPQHDETDDLFRRTQEMVQNLDIQEDRKLEIKNSDFDQQLTSWENSGLNPLILSNVKRLNYTHLRPIQAAVIPQIMRGYDVCGQAETSGGKTAAFGLPVIHKILEYPQAERDSVGRSSAPYSIILAPTRELAKQIYDNLIMFSNGTDVQIRLVYGEMNRWECLRKIQEGCHILVGTCGRVMDYIQRGEVTCKNLRFFILDEADRLLDDLQKGSGTHLSTIMNDQHFMGSHEQRQTLLFSATFNRQVEMAARDFMKRLPGFDDVVRIVITQGRINKRVQLHFLRANNVAEKNDELDKLLKQVGPNGRVPRTLIFVEQKKRTDYVAIELSKSGVKAQSINGDRPQNIRESTLNDFKRGVIDVLVGTDVCSRGLDIADLDRVINFDVPKASVESATDTFIHRVGRTGRLKEGHAYTFVNLSEQNDTALIPSFIELMTNMGREQQIPDWMKNYRSGCGGGGYGGGVSSGSFNPGGFGGYGGYSSSSNPTGGSSGFQPSSFTAPPSSSFGASGFGNNPMPKKEEENSEAKAENEEKKETVEEEDDEW